MEPNYQPAMNGGRDKVRVYQVIRDNVESFLYITYRFIKDIVEQHGCYDKQDLIDSIRAGQMQMFAGFIGKDAKPCVVIITQMQMFPKKRVLFVQYMGGVDMRLWQTDVIAYMQAWARKRDFSEIWAFGRKGLLKLYKDEATSYVLLSKKIT